MAQRFQPFPAGGDRPFLSISQDVIDVLESISAAEKAQAVPHVRIWQVDPVTGAPVHADEGGRPTRALSNQLSEPAAFGRPGDAQFRERPPVSLERITIKSDAPKGVITYRQIEMSFMVHRPDVIFEDATGDHDTWSSLILPGSVHVLEYGWSASDGVKNGLLSGVGLSDPTVKPPINVPAISQIRFTVTNYSFRILPDNQISVSVSAFEDGEYTLRGAALGSPPAPETDSNRSPYALPKEVPLEAYNERGLAAIENIQRRLGDDLKGRTDAAGRVKLSDLLDVVFAPAIEEAIIGKLGYRDLSLILGDFNERVGLPVERYDFRPVTTSPGGKWIGDFAIPLKDVRELFSKLVSSETQPITLYNLLVPFLMVLRDPRTWDRRQGKKDEFGRDALTIPQVFVRVIANPVTRAATLYIFDAEREFTKFSESDYKKGVSDKLTRRELRETLRKKGVPMITFGKGNSYIADANFEVVADENIKSILVRRYLRPTRAQALDVNKKMKELRLPDASKVLYSSSIQGDIVMLGNFAFDLFGLVWLDFGVPVWSGPFSVRSREDVIEPGSFVTKIGFISEGSDPLGTQGRREAVAVLTEQTKIENELARNRKRR